MCIKKIINYFYPPKVKTYYGIDTFGGKVYIRATEMPTTENSRIYRVVSEDEEYIDNLIKEEEDGYLLCQE